MRVFYKSFGTLAGKLIVTVSALLFLGSLVFGFIYFKFQERVMLRNIETHARLSADLAMRGALHGMLEARPEEIQRAVDSLTSSDELFSMKIIDKKGRIAFSSDKADKGTIVEKKGPVMEFLKGNRTEPWMTPSLGGKNVLEYFTLIKNEPRCYTSECHFHKADDKVLGIMQIRLSTSAIQKTERQMFKGTIVLGGFFVFSISVFLFIVIYRFISQPVAELEEGMKRLARGDLEKPIEVHTEDEMGLLAQTFNQMSSDIRHYRERLENWAKELQMEVDKKTAEIIKAQEQLVDAEKLASLGRLAAGVAHELNSPLTGILTFASLLKERMPKDREQDMEDIDVIIEQTNKCATIIRELLGFARKGTSEKISMNINDVIRGSISMVTNQSKFHNIKVDMELDEELPPLVIDPNQLQQVIINIFTNAADAMNDKGDIHITTRTLNTNGVKYVEMEFSDTGPGILPEHMNRVFEPFFTTKPVGQGTGLGLPVSYGIVKRHGGDILVKSKVGEGTTFFVRLPYSESQQEIKEG